MSDSISIIPSVPQDLPAPILDQLQQVLCASLTGRIGLVILVAPASYFRTAPADLDHRNMTMIDMAEKARQIHVQAVSERRVRVLTCHAAPGWASIPITIRQEAALVLDVSKSRWT